MFCNWAPMEHGMSWGDYWCLPFHLCICLRAGEQTQLILTSWSIYWAVHLVLSGIARVAHAIFKNTSLWHYTPGRGICAQLFYCHLSVRTSEEGTSNYKVTETRPKVYRFGFIVNNRWTMVGGVIIIKFWNFDPKVGEMVH